VAEISSFQLDTIDTFRPKVSVLLNITPDHLDRYPDFEAYADSKMHIFRNQQAGDCAVLNGLDRMIRARAKNIQCRRLFFPSLAPGEQGAILKDKKVILNLNKFEAIESSIEHRASSIENRLSLDISKMHLRGRHNLENACAASLAALAAGATLDGIQQALDRFEGLAHRLEHVATINAVQYYNDSKATNVDGVIRALECFSRPVVLLMGGRDKGGNFKLLRDSLRRHVKELIVMGEAAESIWKALGRQAPTKVAASMQAAVDMASQDAAPQDVVLLSPGCASFDWYANYAARGDDFRRAVEKLKRG
jgi:UDP-N-acetylmuramoylalanine--D-glutamate ligase